MHSDTRTSVGINAYQQAHKPATHTRTRRRQKSSLLSASHSSTKTSKLIRTRTASVHTRLCCTAATLCSSRTDRLPPQQGHAPYGLVPAPSSAACGAMGAGGARLSRTPRSTRKASRVLLKGGALASAVQVGRGCRLGVRGR